MRGSFCSILLLSDVSALWPYSGPPVRLQLIFIKFANGKFILLQLLLLVLVVVIVVVAVVVVSGRRIHTENFYLNDFQIMLVLLLPLLHCHFATPSLRSLFSIYLRDLHRFNSQRFWSEIFLEFTPNHNILLL